MSDINDKNGDKKTQTKTNYYIGIAIAIILVLVCVYLGTKSNKSVTSVDSTNTATSSEVIQETKVFDMNTKIEADTYMDINLGNVTISDKLDGDTAAQLQKIQDYLNNIYSKNSLIYLVVGETDADIISQFYNSEYQCYSETSNNLVGIYYDRAKSIIISDIVERTQDATAVDMLQGALDMAKQNKDNVSVTITTEDVYDTVEAEATTEATTEATEETTEATEETEETITETTEPSIDDKEDVTIETTGEGSKGEYLYTQTKTTIKLSGIDTIKEFYSLFGEEFSKSMVDSWNELLKDSDVSNDSLSFDIITTSIDESLGAGAYMTVDGQEYISWYFENYFPFEHWSIDSTDWQKEHTAQELLDMTVKVQEQITSIVNNYKTELGITETEPSTEISDDVKEENITEDNTETSATEVENTTDTEDSNETEVSQ